VATVEEQVREIAQRVAQDLGLEIFDLEFRGGGKARMLRIYIDKPGGVTHEDCANVSREVGTILDVEDVVPGSAYTLEVSSPGLDRKLRNAADFQRFTGSKVRVKTRDAVDGKRDFEGRLQSFHEGRIKLLQAVKKKKAPVVETEIEIALDNVERANLVPEI
jgi:ribosome maturation factor RimP